MTEDITEKSPSQTAVQVAGWTDPTKAYVSDDDYAYSATEGAKQDYYGYGFAIPTGSTIDQVLVRVEHYDSDTEWYMAIKVSPDDGVTWGGWHTLPSRLSEKIDEVDVTADFAWTPEKLANLRVKAQSCYSPPVGCFNPDEYVLMWDETAKRLRDLKRGDVLMGFDNENMQFVPSKVTLVRFHRAKKEIPFIMVKTIISYKNKVFGSSSTIDHKILSKDKWKKAGELDPETDFINHIVEEGGRVFIKPLCIYKLEFYTLLEVIDVRTETGNLFLKDSPEPMSPQVVVWEKK